MFAIGADFEGFVAFVDDRPKRQLGVASKKEQRKGAPEPEGDTCLLLHELDKCA